MIINEKIFYDKLMGCFTGKNIGGTLGALEEGHRQKNFADGYDKRLTLPMPNDDLDIQLLWLIMLEEKGINFDCERLGEYWQRYITPHWAEYGISKINMRAGIRPPMSGTVNNEDFKHSNGAWIRSEIWACLTPGNPEIAASNALCDAVIDHGNGEGTWGEVFLAALQSLAFVNSDIDSLIETALTYIPETTGLYNAITDVVTMYKNKATLDEVRDALLEKYRGYAWKIVAPEDKAKGFADGPVGYDCPLNVAIVIAGILYGEGDFDKTVKSAFFFGEDTDCTVGTAGATFGIIHGMSKIDKKWSEPIGNKISVGTLNLGELGVYGDILPQTVDELAERIYKQHIIMSTQYSLPNAKDGIDTSKYENALDFKASDEFINNAKKRFSSQDYHTDFYTVTVDYLSDDCYIVENTPRKINVTVISEYKTGDIINYRWLLPDRATVSPAQNGRFFLMFKGSRKHSEKTLSFEFTVTEPQQTERFVLELTIDGRTTCIYVPVVFLLGNKDN